MAGSFVEVRVGMLDGSRTPLLVLASLSGPRGNGDKRSS